MSLPVSRFLAQLLLCLPLFLGAVTAEAAPAGLDFLRAFLSGLNTLEADFRQEVTNRDLELVEEASGRVSLKKPGKFRWDYREPVERLIVADGRKVWLYEADLEQVTVRPLDAGLGETPAALLSGEAGVLDRFDYTGAFKEEGLDWIELRPRSAESDFERIRLAFAGDNLVQLALEDRLGQTTRLFLSAVRMNTEIMDDVFRFRIPDGVDVIGETEL